MCQPQNYVNLMVISNASLLGQLAFFVLLLLLLLLLLFLIDRMDSPMIEIKGGGIN